MTTERKRYSTAGAFRRALEERIRNISLREGMDLNRLRRQVAFDRLLARLFRDNVAPWALKGGYALELWFKAARSTIDIDLTVQQAASETGDDSEPIRDLLQQLAGVDVGDWFEYIIGAPVMDLMGAPYGGARYPVEARLDHRVFARFHVDARIGDVVIPPLEPVLGRDWPGFAGIGPARLLMIAREQQFAEKLHAYTLPRQTPNSRVKDLVDLAVLVASGGLDKNRARTALRLTFERRATHEMPTTLAAPPPDWQAPFRPVAQECSLPTDLATVFAMVQEYVGSVASDGT